MPIQKPPEFTSSAIRLFIPAIKQKFEGKVQRIDTMDKIDGMGTVVQFLITVPNEDAIEMFRRLDKALTIVCWGEDKDGG